MSKQTREKLLRHSQCTLDSLFEVLHMENLTIDENKECQEIKEALEEIVLCVGAFVRKVDKRKEEEKPSVPIPPSDFDGSKFSWMNHEERIRLQRKLDQLRKQLRRIDEIEVGDS